MEQKGDVRFAHGLGVSRFHRIAGDRVTEAPPQKNEIVAELIEKIMTPRDIKSKQVVLGECAARRLRPAEVLMISDVS
eukprot:s6120_g1.t1